MIYKKVEQGGDRHVIIDGDSRADELKVTPNLADNQFKIELLVATGCPIRKSCVRIEEGVNSICNHLAYDSADLKRLLCQYGNSAKLRVIDELWVEGCPLGQNCAHCKDLENISIPPSFQPAKSHAHVTCSTRHRKKAH